MAADPEARVTGLRRLDLNIECAGRLTVRRPFLFPFLGFRRENECFVKEWCFYMRDGVNSVKCFDIFCFFFFNFRFRK